MVQDSDLQAAAGPRLHVLPSTDPAPVRHGAPTGVMAEWLVWDQPTAF